MTTSQSMYQNSTTAHLDDPIARPPHTKATDLDIDVCHSTSSRLYLRWRSSTMFASPIKLYTYEILQPSLPPNNLPENPTIDSSKDTMTAPSALVFADPKLLQHILLYLPWVDLVNAGDVCRAWERVARGPACREQIMLDLTWLHDQRF